MSTNRIIAAVGVLLLVLGVAFVGFGIFSTYTAIFSDDYAWVWSAFWSFIFGVAFIGAGAFGATA